MRVVAYQRVSTHKQGASGLGIEAQAEAIRQFVASSKAELLAAHTEVESGGSCERPELIEALRRCRLTGATLVIAKLDRLSRSAAFIAHLQDAGVRFLCCDMPEANDLTIGIMAAMAQHERKAISERTKAAMAAAKRRGVVFGNPRLDEVRNTDTTAALAKRDENARARNADYLAVIMEFEAEAGRPLSGRELAKLLDDAGYRTARGKRFTHTQALRIRKMAA